MQDIYVENSKLKSGKPVSAALSARDEERFTSARAEYYGDAVPGYEEIGNTASFISSETVSTCLYGLR